MKHHITVYTFLLLIVGSWVLEFALGILILRFVWGTAWLPNGKTSSISLAGTFAQSFNNVFDTNSYLLHGTHARLDWTEASIITFLIWVFIALHAVNALWFGFIEPMVRLRKLGARKASGRERDAFEKAFQQLALSSSELINPPRTWRTADGLGLQTRWIGNTLIIDRKLYAHRYFTPLLAHELGNSNSEDRIAHRLYAMLPRIQSVVGTLGGFPLGIGHVLLYPAWLWYWRQRIFAADSFAAKIGQGPALERALDTLYLNMDRATQWGRFWKPVPYVEQRIDRLQNLNRNRP